MDTTEIITSIRSHEKRLKDANERAIAAIGSADYWVAMTAITEAAEHKGAISELEYQLELMEVE